MPFYPSLRLAKSSELDKEKKIRTAKNLLLLKESLYSHFKSSRRCEVGKDSLKLATWNLREFGRGKFKGRDFESLYYIAEIISCFDFIALQEINEDLTSFRKLLKILGPDWDYIATDITDGYAGNGERMVFLYHIGKIRFRNIVGEITLPEGSKITAASGERISLKNGASLILPTGVELSGVYNARLRSVKDEKALSDDLEIPLPEGTTLAMPEGSKLVIPKNTRVKSSERGMAQVDVPKNISGSTFQIRFPNNTFEDSFRQFARTPFLISFQSGWLKLNICTVHIYYGDESDKDKLEQRRTEIEKIAKCLSDKAKKEFRNDEEAHMCLLGDFNIVGKNHPTMAALEKNEFIIPPALKDIPGSNVKKDKAYDQIAFWNPEQETRYSRIEVLGAGVFDFYGRVFREEDESVYRAESNNGLEEQTNYKTWRTYKMSDHLPMWIEINTDFSNKYLNDIAANE